MIERIYRDGLILALAIALGSSVAVAATNDPPWTKANPLLNNGKVDEALTLLLTDDIQQIGLPEYDFLLAKAYRAKGEWQLALFALERVLIIEPNHPGARLMAAGIYADQGMTDWAERELAFLSRDTLDPEMRREANRIDTLVGTPKIAMDPFQYRTSISAGIGYDSNVTYGPGADTISSYLKDSTADDDLFLMLGGTGTFQYALNNITALTGSAGLSRKLNLERSDADEDYLDLGLGLSRQVGDDIFGLRGLFESYWVDNDVYRWYWGVQTDWRHPLKDGAWLSGLVQYAKYTFPDDETYDAGRTVAGLYHWIPFKIDGQDASFQYGFHLGTMEAEDSDSKYVGYDLWGGRVDFTCQPTSAVTVSTGAIFEQRFHNGTAPFYGRVREDNQWTINMSASYDLGNAWSLVASADYTANDSNLAVYEYDRTVVQLTLKKEFSNEKRR